MWTKEQIKSVVTSKPFALAAVSVGSFVSGAAGSYIFLSNRLDRKYQDLANEEILSAKLFYSRRAKDGAYSDPVVLAEQYDDEVRAVVDAINDDYNPITNPQTNMLRDAVQILEEQKYTSYNKPGEDTQTQEEVDEVKQSIKRNIFDTAAVEDTNYDKSAEDEKKENEKPYIIPVAVYMEGEARYAQVCLTYYELDDTLANEIDIPVEDQERVIGEDNLRFGTGSGDPNVVYVRNDVLEEDFEIVRSRGSFADEVAGPQHFDQKKTRKFRDED